jgi:hypothetical protein
LVAVVVDQFTNIGNGKVRSYDSDHVVTIVEVDIPTGYTRMVIERMLNLK